MLPYNVRRHVSATKHISLMRIYTTNYFVVPQFDMQIHGGSENLLIEGKKNEILTEHVSLPLNFNYSKCSSIFFSFLLLLLLRSLDRFFFIKQIFSSSIFSFNRVDKASPARKYFLYLWILYNETRNENKTVLFELFTKIRLPENNWDSGAGHHSVTPRWSATLRAHRGALSRSY